MAYTFKDDGAALTYYREYNKEVGNGDKTLVGNWVEERALRDDVDSGRYKLWTDPTPDPHAPQQSFTKTTARPDGSDTFRRTIAHDDHTPPSNYVTTNNVPDPGYRVYTKPQKGAREKLLEERAWQLAQESAPREQPMAAELVSTHRADFEPKELPPPEARGARVMEGKPDLQWRKELGLVPPHMLEDPNAEVELPGQRGTFGRKTEFSTPIELAKSGIVKDC